MLYFSAASLQLLMQHQSLPDGAVGSDDPSPIGWNPQETVHLIEDNMKKNKVELQNTNINTENMKSISDWF